MKKRSEHPDINDIDAEFTEFKKNIPNMNNEQVIMVALSYILSCTGVGLTNRFNKLVVDELSKRAQ